jgi:hypothetical protein
MMIFSNSLRHLALVALAIVLCTGCTKEEKRERNTKTQLWVYKLSDDLHLAMVPLERSLEPLDKDALRAKFPNPQFPPNGQLRERFVFYMPGATAPENPGLFYDDDLNAHIGKPMDLNVIVVPLIEPWTAEMHRTQPDAQKDARIGWATLTKLEHLAKNPLFEMHGMQCYVSANLSHGYKPISWQEGRCIAERAPSEWAHFDYSNDIRGHIRTEYYSPKYGGLTVSWSTSYRNFSRWREIDAKFWQLIDERNLAKKQ